MSTGLRTIPICGRKRDGEFRPTSYGEMREQVYQFAAGLITLGVKKGDRITLLAEGRTWWVVAEMSMFYLSAIDVPISIQLNEPADLTFRIKHSESRMIIVSGSQARKIDSLKKELPLVEKYIHMDPREKYEKDEVYMGDVMEDGKSSWKRTSTPLKRSLKRSVPTMWRIFVTPPAPPQTPKESC